MRAPKWKTSVVFSLARFALVRRIFITSFRKIPRTRRRNLSSLRERGFARRSKSMNFMKSMKSRKAIEFQLARSRANSIDRSIARSLARSISFQLNIAIIPIIPLSGTRAFVTRRAIARCERDGAFAPRSLARGPSSRGLHRLCNARPRATDLAVCQNSRRRRSLERSTSRLSLPGIKTDG